MKLLISTPGVILFSVGAFIMATGMRLIFDKRIQKAVLDALVKIGESAK